MRNYLVTITDEMNDEYVAYAYGDFETMRYAAKQGLSGIDGKTGDFRARITEVPAIGEEPTETDRVICSVGGDAETVAVVVKKKIATERKSLAAEAGETVPEADAA